MLKEVPGLNENFLKFLGFISKFRLQSYFRCSLAMFHLWLLLNVIFIAVHCIRFSEAGFTIQNSLLNGHVFKTYVGMEWLSCIQECNNEAICFSYNFFPAEKICELNNSGLKDRCDADNNLIRRTGWIYHEIDTSQVNEYITLHANISFYFTIELDKVYYVILVVLTLYFF